MEENSSWRFELFKLEVAKLIDNEEKLTKFGTRLGLKPRDIRSIHCDKASHEGKQD